MSSYLNHQRKELRKAMSKGGHALHHAVTNIRGRLDSLGGDLVEIAEESDADDAEETCENLMKLNNEFEQLFEDVVEGRILDGATVDSFDVAKPFPTSFSTPLLADQHDVCRSGEDPELNWLHCRFEQVQAVVWQAAAELGTIQKNRGRGQRMDSSNPTVPRGSGFIAAINKLSHIERSVADVIRNNEKWSAKAMVKYMSLPGPIPSRALDALTFEITCNIDHRSMRKSVFLSQRRFQAQGTGIKVYGMNSLPHMLVFGSKDPSSDADSKTYEMDIGTNKTEMEAVMKHEMPIWNQLAPEEVSWSSRFMGYGMTEIRLSWTCATHLFGWSQGETVPSSTATQLKVLRAVANSTGDPSPLNTVLGRGIVARAWQECQFDIKTARLADLWCVMCMTILVKNFRTFVRTENNTLFDDQNKNSIIMLTGYSVYSTITLVFEILESANVFGWVAGLYAYFTVWNAITVIMEIFNSLVIFVAYVILMMNGTCVYDLLIGHPVLFALSIFSRWIYCLMNFLGTKVCGNTLLPAFYAVVSYDSMMFLFFVLWTLFGMTNAYWVLPIADNAEFTDTLLKIFRLGALGDFDMNDLEGVNQVIKAEQDVSGHHVMMLEDPEGGSQGAAFFHYGVRYLFIVFSFVSTIMLMNVYIGLLSGEYDKAKENSKTGLALFRARIVIPVILRRTTRRRFLLQQCFKQEKHSDVKGIFISRAVDEFE
eukprot:TRINITY_DN25628_c1_g1_i1.p1 TRINITY_DN25628_c1_g1~~TRINITY_DN25628_c1_g1_i1.p1  ORF type:complete len:709 (-),score=89.67 TRINITY_DN25628_c1_g1_i1:179-2305(-)